MHLVTSSLLLSSIFSLLTRQSQKLLLRGYFATCLVWYIGQGRAELDIARFFGNAATLHPIPLGPKPTPHKDVSPSPTSPFAFTPDPWLPIIQSTLTHPDDHLPKLQRALAEYSSHFGSTPAGYFTGTELKDAELIDGTLFVRAAGLTCGRLGWVREGEPPLETWDIKGFFKVADKIWNIGNGKETSLTGYDAGHSCITTTARYRAHNNFSTFWNAANLVTLIHLQVEKKKKEKKRSLLKFFHSIIFADSLMFLRLLTRNIHYGMILLGYYCRGF